MSTNLCIHGHFYQPPRLDPGLERMLVEAGAAPFRHWNERITAESYAPLAWARRLNGSGRIADILNCYAWMSFNVGPTLLAWMRRAEPDLVRRMREGDAHSLARWGHGNALAQVYHHIIMPLSPAEDRLLETRWAVADFERHFGRKPEGMWLSECAVDLPTLEALAAEGIGFVVLAPRQAEAVREGGTWRPVDEGSLDIGAPHLVRLPSGGSMTVIFYSGGISQDIAFEGLLRDGENFWRHITAAARNLEGRGKVTPLLSIATDGETYGHHFPFGEMALAYVLGQAYTGRDGVRLTNFAAHIAAHPPVTEVRLRDPSSWSCVHGVERWRSDCGCSDGGHPGWRQTWRGPLRAALEIMRDGTRAHYDAVGPSCFTDAKQALLRYGEVLADPEREPEFAEEFYKPGKADVCRNLLAMRERALAAFASCAWFFDDISRIEPQNGLSFALAALDLLKECGGPDLLPRMEKELEKAPSNRGGSGADILRDEILPRRLDDAGLILAALLRLAAEDRLPAPGESARCDFTGVEIRMAEPGSGTAVLRRAFAEQGVERSWKANGTSLDFAALAQNGISVRRDGSEETAQTFADFSHPLREYLLDRFMARREATRRPELLAQARAALAFFPRKEEGRNTFTRPECWAALVPFFPAAAMHAESPAPETLETLAAFLAPEWTPAGRREAEKLVTETFLAELDHEHPDDARLAAAVSRVAVLLPQMTWWRVQNRVWDKGPTTLPQLAESLGFL